jgi:tetratricopeptide (TPR) repeat protein
MLDVALQIDLVRGNNTTGFDAVRVLAVIVGLPLFPGDVIRKRCERRSYFRVSLRKLVVSGETRRYQGKFGLAGEFWMTDRYEAAAGAAFPSVFPIFEVIPRQLPPPPADLVGREDELVSLDRILRSEVVVSGGPAVAVAVGPGGVGKTALAVTWAARHPDDFPDGQLYMDVRGFSPEAAAEPDEVLGSFLRALGVPPERVPVDLAEQVGLYRTVTAGRRLLVVVDNAVSSAQVRPLIPSSAGCAVVVTSRLRLDGLVVEGARFVDVTPLPNAAGVELLDQVLGERRVTEEPAALGELARLCGGLPLALCVVAARLAARPSWPVRRVVDQLRDERARLEQLAADSATSVGSAFDWSYRALPDEAARFYRLLSAHPAPDFSTAVSAAVTTLSEAQAGETAQLLVDASLLDEIGADRYRFHDLIRLHGRASRPEVDAEGDEVVPRVAAWYLEQMTRANLVVIPMRWRVSTVCEKFVDEPAKFASGQEALRWLEAELPSILRVLEQAVALRHSELAWQLCEALWEFFLHRKYYPEWLHSHELGIVAAQRSRHPVAEARLRCQVARAYLDLGQYSMAERECLRAAELARGAKDRRNESVALDQLGMAALGVGEFDVAVGFFADSMEIERELGIELGVAQRHRRIGEALLHAGRHADAAGHLETALTMFARLGSAKDEANTKVALARLDVRTGRPDLARPRLEQARPVLAASGSAVYEAELLMASAEVAESDDQRDVAGNLVREAVALLDRVGGTHLERAEAMLRALE